MNKLFLLFSIFSITAISHATVGTYNLRFSYECMGNVNAPLFDYYLGPTADGGGDGSCAVDPSKTCHDYQQFATFFHEPENKTSIQSICDDLGMARCEFITVYIKRDESNSADQLCYERTSQKPGSSETLEVKKITLVPGTTLEGSILLPGQNCVNEFKYQLIPVE
jgi:hypothetical protein